MSKRINSIDILRMAAAFLVVLGHDTTAFVYPYVSSICYSSVLMFFAVSGYFYCVPKEKKKGRIKKIFILTVITNIAFFLFYAVVSLKDTGIVNYLAKTFTIDNMLKFIVLNDSPFSEHLWFLSALLYCMIIDYFLSDFLMKRKKICIAMIVILLLCDLIFGKYSLLLFRTEFDIVYLRNFLFVGIPFFYIGKLFKSIDVSKIKIKNISLAFLIVLFCATTMVEKYTLMYFGVYARREQYLSLTLLTVVVLLFVLKNPLENPGRLSGYIAYSGRKYSLAIYVVHPILIFVSNFAAKHLGTVLGTAYSFVSGIVIFLTSWLVAIIYYRLKDKIYKPYKTKL